MLAWGSLAEHRSLARRPLVRVETAFHLLIILLLLLISTAAWSRTAEPLPRYDIRVDVKPEALAVDTKVTLPPAAAPRRSLQFKLLPSMGTRGLSGNVRERPVSDWFFSIFSVRIAGNRPG